MHASSREIMVPVGGPLKSNVGTRMPQISKRKLFNYMSSGRVQIVPGIRFMLIWIEMIDSEYRTVFMKYLTVGNKFESVIWCDADFPSRHKLTAGRSSTLLYHVPTLSIHP